MLDKNGKEIKTGMIVKIEGAYFKNDNGVYLVTNSPKDPQWYGGYHSLRKINRRTGALSTAKHNIGFWPVACFTNSYETRRKCNEWNEEHASIEVIEGVPLAQVTEYFEVAASRAGDVKSDIIRRAGCMTAEASEFDRLMCFFLGIVEDLKKGGVR